MNKRKLMITGTLLLTTFMFTNCSNQRIVAGEQTSPNATTAGTSTTVQVETITRQTTSTKQTATVPATTTKAEGRVAEYKE
jgi:hypothetical protein